MVIISYQIANAASVNGADGAVLCQKIQLYSQIKIYAYKHIQLNKDFNLRVQSERVLT